MSESPTSIPAPRFNPEALTLQETRLLQLALTDTLPAPPQPLPVAISPKAEIFFNAQLDDALRVDVSVTITDKAKPKRGAARPRVQVRLAALFYYVGLGELRRRNALPLPLAWTAISLAYSTLRGILQVKLAGTSFSQALLPIVNPQTLWQPPTLAPADGARPAASPGLPAP